MCASCGTISARIHPCGAPSKCSTAITLCTSTTSRRCAAAPSIAVPVSCEISISSSSSTTISSTTSPTGIFVYARNEASDFIMCMNANALVPIYVFNFIIIIIIWFWYNLIVNLLWL